MSSSQPDPINIGEVVSDALLSDILNMPNLLHEEKLYVYNLVKERDAFGRRKYGQPLMSMDGRDTIKDIEDEIGDMLQYCKKLQMQGDEEGKKVILKRLEMVFKAAINILE